MVGRGKGMEEVGGCAVSEWPFHSLFEHCQQLVVMRRSSALVAKIIRCMHVAKDAQVKNISGQS
jgi:hypothetical protein